MKTQNKQQHNLKKLAILLVILIACSIFVSAVGDIPAQDNQNTATPDFNQLDSTYQDSQSQSATTVTTTVKDAKAEAIATADKNIDSLTNDYKNNLKVDYNDKIGLTYITLISNSIDENIAAKALLDQALGFIKIAEFKKDYEIVPNKIAYKAISSEDNKNGIRITKFDSSVQDNSLVLNSELQILNKEKDYSINYAIVYSSENLNDVIFSNPKSEKVYGKLESGQIRISKKTITFDELKRRGFDTSKGISNVQLMIYDKLDVEGNLEDKEKDAIIKEIKDLVGEAQEITMGTNTKFTPEFFPSRKELTIKIVLDDKDRGDFFYQFEINTVKDKILFPADKKYSIDEVKDKTIRIPFNSIGISRQSDMQLIALNVYAYESADKPIYYKLEDLTNKATTTVAVDCTKCNDDNICTLSECQGLGKDNCAWIPDQGIWLSAKDFLGVGSYNTISNAGQESGICKEKKSITPEEECRVRCESRTCLGAQNKCAIDKKCMIESEDKCVVNENYQQFSALPKSDEQKLNLLKTTYSSLISEIISDVNNKNIDAPLIYSILLKESGSNPNAVSQSGAIGLMQIIYSTGCEYNRDCVDKWNAVNSKKINFKKQILTRITSCGPCQKDTIAASDCKTKCLSTPQTDDRFNPDKSIETSINILNEKMKSFNSYAAQKELGIDSYNMGEGYVHGVVDKITGSKDILPVS